MLTPEKLDSLEVLSITPPRKRTRSTYVAEDLPDEGDFSNLPVDPDEEEPSLGSDSDSDSDSECSDGEEEEQEEEEQEVADAESEAEKPVRLNKRSRALLERSYRSRRIEPACAIGKGDAAKVFYVPAYTVEPGRSVPAALRRLVLGGNDATSFWKEVRAQEYLASFGLAPQVYDVWIVDCERQGTVGLVLMEEVKFTYEDNWNQQTELPPPEVEQQLIGVLEAMLLVGVVHNDTHPGNIAVTHDNRIVLLDCGLVSAPMPADAKSDTWWYSELMQQGQLTAHLYYVLEHAKQELMYKSKLYDAIYDLRRGDYAFGANLPQTFRTALTKLGVAPSSWDFRHFTESERRAILALRTAPVENE